MNKKLFVAITIAVTSLLVSTFWVLTDNTNLPDESATNGKLWQSNLENFAMGITVANGKVFTIDISGTINCFSTNSGSRMWKEAIGGYWGSGIVASSSMVYGGKEGTKVGALNANTGKFQWAVGSFWNSAWSERAPSNIDVLDDRLYVTSDNFQVYDATTGELLWENQNNDFNRNSNVTHPAWVLAWPFENDRLFGVGGGLNVGRFIYRLDPDTGAMIWNKPCSFAPRDSPIVYKNQVIVRNVTDEKTTILSLDENSGNLLWTYDVSAKVFQPIAYNGLLFFGAADNSFYALDLLDGSLMWNTKVESQNITELVNNDNPLEYFSIQVDYENQKIIGGFAVTTQRVVNGTQRGDEYWGFVCSLDIETGNIFWEKNFSGNGDISNNRNENTFALTENAIFLNTLRDLRIISKSTGEIIEIHNFEHSLNSPIEENGIVFIAADLWLMAYK